VVREKVAGINLGSEQHWVCAPGGEGSSREIDSFGATAPELIRMAEWLKARRGVYGIAPHEILEGQGFEVLVVDTRQLARVPGRSKKTDPSDCDSPDILPMSVMN